MTEDTYPWYFLLIYNNTQTLTSHLYIELP